MMMRLALQTTFQDVYGGGSKYFGAGETTAVKAAMRVKNLKILNKIERAKNFSASNSVSRFPPQVRPARSPFLLAV